MPAILIVRLAGHDHRQKTTDGQFVVHGDSSREIEDFAEFVKESIGAQDLLIGRPANKLQNALEIIAHDYQDSRTQLELIIASLPKLLQVIKQAGADEQLRDLFAVASESDFFTCLALVTVGELYQLEAGHPEMLQYFDYSSAHPEFERRDDTPQLKSALESVACRPRKPNRQPLQQRERLVALQQHELLQTLFNDIEQFNGTKELRRAARGRGAKNKGAAELLAKSGLLIENGSGRYQLQSPTLQRLLEETDWRWRLFDTLYYRPRQISLPTRGSVKKYWRNVPALQHTLSTFVLISFLAMFWIDLFSREGYLGEARPLFALLFTIALLVTVRIHDLQKEIRKLEKNQSTNESDSSSDPFLAQLSDSFLSFAAILSELLRMLQERPEAYKSALLLIPLLLSLSATPQVLLYEEPKLRVEYPDWFFSGDDAQILYAVEPSSECEAGAFSLEPFTEAARYPLLDLGADEITFGNANDLSTGSIPLRANQHNALVRLNVTCRCEQPNPDEACKLSAEGKRLSDPGWVEKQLSLIFGRISSPAAEAESLSSPGLTLFLFPVPFKARELLVERLLLPGFVTLFIVIVVALVEPKLVLKVWLVILALVASAWFFQLLLFLVFS